MYKYLLLLLILVTASFSCFSQEKHSLQGRVVDQKTQFPLPFAHIIIKSREIGFVTDEEGLFAFNLNTFDKLDTVVFSYLGYERKAMPVANMPGDTMLKILLTPQPTELEEVVIQASPGEDFMPVEFMTKAVAYYNRQKRETPHIARAYYKEKAKIDNKYVFFNESLGYSIYMGEQIGWAPLALFKFYCENTRVSTPAREWRALLADSTKASIGAGACLNFFRHFEKKGLLSQAEISKYKFKLDSLYLESGKLINVISFSRGKETGTVFVQDNLEITQVKFKNSKRLWLNAKQKRVKASGNIRFTYFNGIPFVSEINIYHADADLEYWNRYKLIAQKLGGFSLAEDDIAALNNYDRNPLITYNHAEWTREIGEDWEVDIDSIGKDMGVNAINLEKQFVMNAGKLYIPSEPNQYYELAQKIIANLKSIF